jgi:hypothetical protein
VQLALRMPQAARARLQQLLAAWQYVEMLDAEDAARPARRHTLNGMLNRLIENAMDSSWWQLGGPPRGQTEAALEDWKKGFKERRRSGRPPRSD